MQSRTVRPAASGRLSRNFNCHNTLDYGARSLGLETAAAALGAGNAVLASGSLTRTDGTSGTVDQVLFSIDPSLFGCAHADSPNTVVRRDCRGRRAVLREVSIPRVLLRDV